MLNTSTILMVLVFAGTIFFGCNKKEHHPKAATTQESHKWDTIAGHYKVYDTIDNYLYDMDLVHIHNDSTGRDSIRFENFDGQFTFTTMQEEFSNYPNYVAIGAHNLLYDTNNKRWKIGSAAYDYYNNFQNDTIPFRFQITNILYWMQDAVAYYSGDIKQIAIKQH